ncbi:MAG: DUF192 domain-containing protein [Candidatus Doudnabacteria bacterium]|nr:DUF192 domain-containing protein [Candidatus Doudnabacteria bacterium]
MAIRTSTFFSVQKVAKISFPVLALILLSVSCSRESAFPVNPARGSGGKVIIKNTIVPVELAQTPEERRLGLSRRKELLSGEGMLFIFPEKGYHSFWMKDMKFPLDLVWIDDGRIVGIDQQIYPEESRVFKIYTPQEPVFYVLEINAGEAKRNGWEVGDEVEIVLSRY